MKPYHRNPRQITKKKLDKLTDTLARLGDLGGIVHNLETDEIIGGHQRMKVFTDGKPEVMQTYPEPDEQGTVGHGFIVWKGKRYAYRQVRWDEATAAEANIVANAGGGTWDWDVVANQWDAGDLIEWGLDDSTLADWRRDVAALGAMVGSEDPELDTTPQNYESSFDVIVTCADEQAQIDLLEKLTDEGYQCQALVS